MAKTTESPTKKKESPVKKKQQQQDNSPTKKKQDSPKKKKQESPKKKASADEETYPMEDMNNKSDETTPLTKDIPVEEGSNGGNATAASATTENNAPLNNETSGLEEKLSALEKDAEAGGAGATNSSSKRKSITAAIIAAEDLLENPKIRLILGIVGAVLLFLFVLVLAIVIIVSESDDDTTHRFIRLVPRPRGPHNLIYYRHGDLKKVEKGVRSWLDMVEEVDQFLAPYRRPENAELCPFSTRTPSTTPSPSSRRSQDHQDHHHHHHQEEKVCLFDLNTVSKECLQGDYGYMAGRPCIYIVFNNISDWLPEGYNVSAAPSIIGVDCTPNTQFDAENVGPMEFTPYQGFSSIFFPFHGQRHYMAPFIALRLSGISSNFAVGLTCRLVSSSSANETEVSSSSSSDEPVPFIPFNILIE